MVEWCELSAKCYTPDLKLEIASTAILERFAETAPLSDSTCFNFFRGVDETGYMIDLHEINYT